MPTAKLDKQTRYIAGVIDFPYLDDTEWADPIEYIDTLVSLRRFFDLNCLQWFFIVHDRFTDEEDQEAIHIHFVVKIAKRTRLGTWIARVQRGLLWDKERRSLISVEPAKDYALAVQYLIHKNDITKYQFPVDDIQTNVKDGILKGLLESDGSFVDAERLIDVVSSSSSKADILTEIGIDAYMRYRSVISDLWPVYHGNSAYDPPVAKHEDKYVLKA